MVAKMFQHYIYQNIFIIVSLNESNMNTNDLKILLFLIVTKIIIVLNNQKHKIYEYEKSSGN